MARDAGQRAAFGNFCLNAASFPLPEAIEHRTTPDHTIYFIRRRFFGFRSPMVNALIEPRTVGPQTDVWRAAEALLPVLSDPEPPHIVKLFLAGSVRERADQSRLVGQGRYQGVFLPFDTPEALDLPSDYESLLQSLGRHTRRDMRRVRRDAQHAGFVFEFRQPVHDGRAERHMLGLATHPRRYRPDQIDAYDRFLAAQESPFHALLRSASGELISCCAGFIGDGSAYVLYQLNHEHYRDQSLSLTNRTFAIEHLISLGIREFVLPGGGSGILIHSCRMRADGELVLIRRAVAPILKSLAVTSLRPQSSIALAVRHLVNSWIG